MKKKKYFDHSNNYLETFISKVVGFNTSKVGYTENYSHYYYWYDIKYEQDLIDNVDKIISKINKIEKCNAHVCHIQCEDNEVVLILFKE